MRLLFLLLLLANLLFLAWNAWIATPPVRPGQSVRAAEAGPNRLRLLRELPDGDQPSGAGVSLPAADCVSAGPFLERSVAERGLAQLGGVGFEGRLRESVEDVSVGQWVRVIDLATPADAANALAALRAAGAADAALVDEGAGGTIVSIGVYTDPERTAGALELARRTGYTAEVGARTRSAQVYWIDVDRLANGGLPAPENFTDPAAAPPVPPLELRACPATPVAGG